MYWRLTQLGAGVQAGIEMGLDMPERATGREIRGVIEQAIGRSSEEALDASQERISARWGTDAEPAGDAAVAGGQADAPELPPELGDTLRRAEPALAAAPTKTRRRWST